MVLLCLTENKVIPGPPSLSLSLSLSLSPSAAELWFLRPPGWVIPGGVEDMPIRGSAFDGC